MGDWQDNSWGSYNQQDWSSTQGGDGFQQFDYSGYTSAHTTQNQGNDVYGQDQMYSGNVFIPESVDPAPGGIKGHSAFDDEPPLLEELGIHPEHIMQKTLTVLNPLRTTDPAAAGDSDLAGPLCFCLAFGSFLMLSGKLHFNYIYGIGLLGCVCIYALLNLMAVSGVAICTVVSVLGYCLIPIVGLSGLSVLFSLTGLFGNILTILAVLWCTASSSKLFVTALEMRDQQVLVAYPCGLLYSVFALITMF